MHNFHEVYIEVARWLLKYIWYHADETQNSVVNAASCLGNGVLLPLVNSLWHFDGTGNHLIKQLPNQISAVYLRGSTLLLGEQSSKGKLISAVLLDILTPEVGRTFSFQKSSINYLSISPDNRYIVSVGSSDKFKCIFPNAARNWWS